jgi:hypothetical protein
VYLKEDNVVFRLLLDGEEVTIEDLRESGEAFVNEMKATIINEPPCS